MLASCSASTFILGGKKVIYGVFEIKGGKKTCTKFDYLKQ